MDLLVCAATWRELAAWPGAGDAFPKEGMALSAGGDFACVLTGVGIPATLGTLPDRIREVQPRRILNLGIAGAYPGSGLVLGDVVVGESEVYGDVGFELPQSPGFRSISDSEFAGELYSTPLLLARDPAFVWEPSGYRAVSTRGCTVNACTGTEPTGRLRENLFGAAFESMEGAAVAQAGQGAGVPVCEVRAVSNIAGRRSITAEGIGSALQRLAEYLRGSPYWQERS